MSAPESFIEQVRAGLVNPRRNLGRAIDRVSALRPTSPRADGDNALYFLEEAREQLAYVESIVNEAAAHEVHTCSCGHVHYLHGDQA